MPRAVKNKNNIDYSRKVRKKRLKKLLPRLKELFPAPEIALNYSNNWELFVAVVLSAQCTDKKVNEVTEKLFKKYQTLNDYAHADPKEFQKDIKSTGFYKQKTKRILESAKIIKEKYNGKLPKTMEEIVELPGVGRKSANVILGNAFDVVEGIAVDTHVRRFAQVFGLSRHEDPEKIEKDLMEITPKEEWFTLTYRLIEYGRQYCEARKHSHVKRECPLRDLYVYRWK